MTIKVCRGNDKVGRVEGQETLAIETAWIALWQHEGFADTSLDINVTEIGTRIETVIPA